MSFVFDIGGKKRAVARYIGLVRRRLIEAVIEAEREEGITRADIARKIDCHRSRITRQLRGSSDLTLRSISEIAWALGKRPIFELENVDPNGIRVNQADAIWEGNENECISTFSPQEEHGECMNEWKEPVLQHTPVVLVTDQ